MMVCVYVNVFCFVTNYKHRNKERLSYGIDENMFPSSIKLKPEYLN